MSDSLEHGGYIPRDRDWQPPALAPEYKSSRLRSPRQPLLSLPTTL
jgi:protocatechuate 3,4-dioxygenase beta subunit